MPCTDTPDMMSLALQALWALTAVNKSNVPARKSAAAVVLSSFNRHAPEAQALFQQMTKFCDQLISLCYHQPPPKAQ